MTVEIEWSAASQRDVLHMPWRVAARICTAVLALAQRGEGILEPTDEPSVYRLRVHGAAALVRLDRAARTLHVRRLYVTR